MARTSFVPCAVVLALAIPAFPLQVPASAPDPLPFPVELQRVSLTDLGQETLTCTGPGAGCKNNSHPSLSADGMLAAFESDAGNVVASAPNPGNLRWIYVRDLSAGTTELVSLADADAAVPGAPPNDGCGFPVISQDGRFVAYNSTATNLVGEDVDPTQDVFVRDRWLGRTRRVNASTTSGAWALGAGSPWLSADGSLIAFGSASVPPAPVVDPGSGSNLEIVETPVPYTRIFCVTPSGEIEWIDRPYDLGASVGDSSHPSLSSDGRWLAFESNAFNLLPTNDANGSIADVFVRDRTYGQLVCASADLSGLAGGTFPSTKPSISGNGRFVVFESRSPNLVPRDNNGTVDVFVRDLDSKRTIRVSEDVDGHEVNLESGYAAISANGRFVLFSSRADRLVPMQSESGRLDVFLRDRDVRGDGIFDEPGDVLVRIVSVTPEGVQGNAVRGGNAALSADGSMAVFMSHADNLVPFDTNGFPAPGSGSTCSEQCTFGRDVFWARFW